jgi:chemotaxis protein CheD
MNAAPVRHQARAVGANFVTVLPGRLHVTDAPEEVLVTVLGPCVAACIRDPIARIGGMNHFMLPSAPRGRLKHVSSADMRFGEFAMPQLIHDIMVRGGRLERLEAWVFGGASVSHNSDIGRYNAEFVELFHRKAGIPIIESHLRSNPTRRVRFSPHSGKILVSEPHDPASLNRADHERTAQFSF